ncbi:hypothetical protein [Trinickia mobilis]|uniref:hypothetical protein n=1 Tax=Trinickia mobilis TaxID=2816356 RepID=UPI001A8F77EC|nr:hypothetical protein [Trinickia mobilis]
MLQSSDEYIARAPRDVRPRRARTPERLVSYVSIDVTVPGNSSSAARRALHAALGDDLRLYVVTMDKLRDCVTFRIEVTSRPLDEVIAALTRTLSQATLGHAVTTKIRGPAIRGPYRG